MPSRLALCFIICVSILCGNRQLTAQTRSFRMELSELTHGQISLVNESDKPIEAFHFVAKCSKAGQQVMGDEFSRDSLDTYGDYAGVTSDGKAQPVVISPHARMDTRDTLLVQPSGCFWQADIDAVIYADGTYEGDENAVRNLQARRDGLAASLRYWIDRIDREGADGPTREHLLADAEIPHTQNSMRTLYPHPPCNQSGLACAYWMGRMQTDMNILTRGPKTDTAGIRYQRMTSSAFRLQRKFDRDEAFKVLDAKFPLPESLADEGSADHTTGRLHITQMLADRSKAPDPPNMGRLQ